ncbi:MAG: cation:proton antiporter family protein [Verrucomicrobiota bacterium]
MEPLLIAVAFAFGLVAQHFRLPPLVGFLVSGFVLRAFGLEGSAALSTLADLGVTLMLFTIGIKLRLRTLARAEIWAGTTIHASLVVLVFTPLLVLVGGLLVGLEWKTALLLAFALSFSSTVFAVKSLEENGEMGAMHGRVAIGILIMQDILAVLFLTFSTGKIPAWWAILLIAALVLGRQWLGWLVARSGHGELVLLCGLFLALFVGAQGFETVKLKADLGALFVGVLVGYHAKAKEISKSLIGITDLFLIGFFLQIGLTSTLSVNGVLWGLGFLVLLPFKSAAFLVILTRFRLRARTAWLAGLSLSTYSEFGLIVLALAAKLEWISPDWLVAMAVAISLSILVAAPLGRRAEELYDPISHFLKKLETRGRHPDDLPVVFGEARVAIFGMGRVGFAAYKALNATFPGKVIAFDRDPASVDLHQEQGRNVKLADATDSDFWEKAKVRDQLDLVVLAMPKHSANVHAAETLQRHDFQGVVAATGKFDDDVKELKRLGVDTAFNLYGEAGSGFAAHIFNVFNQQRPDLVGRWKRRMEEEDSE